MATPEINATQGATLGVITISADEVFATAGVTIAVYNFPTEELNATQAQVMGVGTGVADVRVTQGTAMAVVKGRINNPSTKAWWYTLDGHDYYVLKLGTTGKTLIYDLSTDQWAWWSSGDSPSWRPSCGLNWRSSGSVPINYGTNVIVGDDSIGTLWVLDPMYGLDTALLDDSTVTFERVATGQIPIRGRLSIPVYATYLTASLGDPSLTLNSVKLEYSDDQGHTYIDANEPQVAVASDYAQEFVWRSMGQVRAPGRMFRITDNGAFARIDAMNINEDEGN